MEPIEQINEDFNVNGKKTKKKGLIIGLLATVLAIAIAFILVYVLVVANPKYIFGKTIDKLFTVDSESYESIKMDTKIKASIDLEDTAYDTELKEIEKFTLKAGTQMDVKKKQEIVDLGLEYDNQNVVDARVYYDDGDMYAYFDGIFDKYIELDIDEETKAILDEVFETATTEENLKNTEKAIEIIKDELKSQIKENGEFDKDKEEIKVGKKDIKVNKSTVTINEKQAYKILRNMFSNLAENDKFLDCFEESPKKLLKEAATSLKDIEGDSDNKVKISLYTKGFLNSDLMGVTVEIYSADASSTIITSVIKEEKDSYSYKLSVKSSGVKADLVKGKVEIEKDKDTKKEQSGKIILTTEALQYGSIKLEIEYSAEYNQGIDKVDTSNSVNMNNLTETDLQNAMTKLMDKPLIGDIIKNTTQGIGNPSITNPTITDPSTTTPTITNPTVEPSTTIPTGTTEQDEIKDYGYSVKYTVPAGFVYSESTSYDDMKFYDLEKPDNSYVDATVTIWYSTEKEYIEDDINWDYNYYLEDTTYYKNVNLSEVKSVVVGGKTFKYKVLSYETSYGGKNQDIYVWYALDNEHLFTIELEATDTVVTEDTIKGFLNINASKIN